MTRNPTVTVTSTGGPPILHATPETVDADALRAVRAFHLGGDAQALEPVAGSLLPALLAPYGDASSLRTDYPLLLDSSPDATPGRPLCDALVEALVTVAPAAEQARLLKDNLARVERFAADAVRAGAGLLSVRQVLSEAGPAVASALGLRSEHAEKLQRDLEAVVEALPADGMLARHGRRTTLQLLRHAVRRHLAGRRATLGAERASLAEQMRSLLRVDREKRPSAREAETLRGSVGAAGAQFVDPAALSAALGPYRGAAPMEAHRRARVEAALEALEAELDPPAMVVVHDGGTELDWLAGPDTCVVEAEEPFATAAALFDEHASALAETARARRVARLESKDGYDPARHDPWLAGFDWQAFSRDELLQLPAVVVVTSGEALTTAGFSPASRVMVSGRPVRIVALVEPAGYPGGESLQGARLELGYVGISHRQELVHQSSLMRPEHLLAGFVDALGAARASLHVVATSATINGGEPDVGAWLHGGAALEGRAHPLFVYDPEAGSTWARRLRFEGNAAPEQDWPTHPLACRTPDGGETTLSLAFTFADFALLEPDWRGHFRLVPEGCTGDPVLVPLDAYMGLEAEVAAHSIPFVWAVDAESQLRRVTFSREMTSACRDRLGFWRTLQELAGVRNAHVEAAVARAKEEAEVAAAEHDAVIEEAHRAELDQVQQEAAGQAMERLAAVLTDVSAEALTAAPRSAAPAARAPAVAEPETELPEPVVEAEAEEEEEEEVSDEPWIDTPLCTSCNDCTNINSLVFIYDDNKQALLGDPKAGTYAEMVKAAELCPANCIHPGKPLDPGEPDLEALLERAAQYL